MNRLSMWGRELLFGEVTVLLSLVVALLSTAARADVACGDTITKSTTLRANLSCAGPGLVIGANNVRLNLNGHTIAGPGLGDDESIVGVASQGHKNITIANGTIEGFHRGVVLSGIEDVTLSDLFFEGMVEDSVIVFGGRNVRIRNSSMLDPVREPGTGIFLASVENFDVSNVDVQSYFFGVLLDCAGPCDESQPDNKGVIRNSSFRHTSIGVLISSQTSSRTQAIITGNHFTQNNNAILSGPLDPGVRLTVSWNRIDTHSDIGIFLVDVVGSLIAGNWVRNSALCGIELVSDVFGSTDNKIVLNLASGNGTDLCHDEGSVGNLWRFNRCDTKVGDEIPECQ